MVDPGSFVTHINAHAATCCVDSIKLTSQCQLQFRIWSRRRILLFEQRLPFHQGSLAVVDTHQPVAWMSFHCFTLSGCALMTAGYRHSGSCHHAVRIFARLARHHFGKSSVLHSPARAGLACASVIILILRRRCSIRRLDFPMKPY